MPAIAFGLSSKAKPDQRSPGIAGRKRKQNVFGDEDQDTTTNPTTEEALVLNCLDDDVSRPPKTQKISNSTGNSKNSLLEFANLSALHTAKKQSDQANTVDPTMYDYDAVYESFHTPRNGKSLEDTKGTAPKYMTNLLKSSEIRKRDQLRAKELLLQKEREAEGDDFAGKEKFVTAAYRAQQEENRKLEREEAVREAAEEDKRKNGGGLTGFYKELLKKDEQRSMEILIAAQEVTAKREVENGEAEDKCEEKSAAQVAVELNARGANVAVNDEGEVVDKRQLLSAGLNVAAKPRSVLPQSRNTGAQVPRGIEPPASATSARQAQRERQTRMIAEQLKNMAEQQAQEEAENRNELEAARSKKNSEEISSARDRYLARKRQAQDSEKAKKFGT